MGLKGTTKTLFVNTLKQYSLKNIQRFSLLGFSFQKGVYTVIITEMEIIGQARSRHISWIM